MKESVKNSKNTAMKTMKPAPAIVWLEKEGYFSKEDSILDYGAGHGRNVKYLRDLGYNITGFDPHNSSDLVTNEIPNVKFDVVFTSFVLNVVDKAGQTEVEYKTRAVLKDTGTVLHIVRNKDIVELAKKHEKDPEEGFYTTRGFQRLVKVVNQCQLLKATSGYKIFK